MKPTMKLRFVEREIGYSKTGNVTDFKTVCVLQQWWVPSCQTGCSEPINYGTPAEYWIENVEGAGEWRDVPLDKE